MSKIKTIAVLTPAKKHYDDFLRRVWPEDATIFVCITTPEQLAGIELQGVIRVGPDDYSHKFNDLHKLALSRVRP